MSRFDSFSLFLLVCSCASFPALGAVPSPLGRWETADKQAVVEIYACPQAQGDFCGRFVWLQDDGAQNPSRDDKNPDPVLRERPLCGLTFMGGFSADLSESGAFPGGWIYSPRHGATFSAGLRLEDEQTLVLRGYVFVPFLGGEETWTRAAHDRVCPLLDKKDS